MKMYMRNLMLAVLCIPFSLIGINALINKQKEVVQKQFGYAADENFSRKKIAMEDRYHVEIASDYAFFGLYDGHLGSKVADYAAQYLHENCDLAERKTLEEIKEGLTAGFIKTNNDLGEYGNNQGSTATVAVIRGNLLVVANAGDSRAVLCNAGIAIPLSQDHTPRLRPDEMERVKKVYLNEHEGLEGWEKYKDFFLRLHLSRTLGDKKFNPYSIPDPEITSTFVTPKDEFLIIASDGVWDVLDRQGAVDIVKGELNNDPTNFSKAANALVREALNRGSADHVSVIVAGLQ